MQNVTVGKYYYAVTPRSESRNVSERVRVVAINGNNIQVRTVDTLRIEEIFTLTIDKFRML